jgi:hypothetical protein
MGKQPNMGRRRQPNIGKQPNMGKTCEVYNFLLKHHML